MTQPRFNLLDEPWVPVVLDTEERTELSMLDLLVRAHEVQVIDTELPTQQYALLRVLLAFLHRAYGPMDEDEWVGMWVSLTLDRDPLLTYADKVRERFWLDHPEHPFMQRAGMMKTNSKVDGPDRLVTTFSEGLFNSRRMDEQTRMRWQEAALWVIHAHAYDCAGIKSGTVGDPLVKAGKRYPQGPAWPGMTNALYLGGGSLRETLLLNLVSAEVIGYQTGSDDLPCWERDPGEEPWVNRTPTGMIDLLTWQARMVRLFWEGDAVSGAVLSYGLPVSSAGHHNREPFAAWQWGEDESKALGTTAYIPVNAKQVGERLWNGLAGVMISKRSVKGKVTPPEPGVIRWLSHLLSEGFVDHNHPMRLVSGGLVLGTEDLSVVTDSVADSLVMPAVAMKFDAPQARAVCEAAQVAQDVGYGVGLLVKNLSLSSGQDPGAGSTLKSVRNEAQQAFLRQVDGPLRYWIAGTGDNPDLKQWQQTLATEARRAFSDALAQVSSRQWVAGVKQTNEGQKVMNPSEAERRFWHGLRATLPLAFPSAEADDKRWTSEGSQDED